MSSPLGSSSTHRADKWKGRKRQPPLVGPISNLSQPGSSIWFLRWPCKPQSPDHLPSTRSLSFQEAKKVTNPKNAESQSEAEQESGGGVGREMVARKTGKGAWGLPTWSHARML